MSKKKIETEILIVGTGPGACTSAVVLARKGFEITMLEKGDAATTEDFQQKDIGDLTQQLYNNGGVQPVFGTPIFPIGEGACLGGGSTVNGALMWRTPDWILQDWSENLGLKSFGKEGLTPYFEKIEEELNVCFHTELADYNKDSSMLKQAAEELNWKVVPVPRAINSCQNSNLCGTGCPSGAKNSMLTTYIRELKSLGVKILTNTTATHIKTQSGGNTLVEAKGKETNYQISCKKLILAGGAISTPFLLKKSKLIKSIQPLQFHWNIKLMARFDEDINADKGTIFTHQVQEFEKEGILMMPSLHNKQYLASGLSEKPNNIIAEWLANFAKTAVQIVMVKPQSHINILTKGLQSPMLRLVAHKADLAYIQKALGLLTKVVFQSGAKELILPIGNAATVHNQEEALELIENLNMKDLQMVSVHIMSSCRMGISPGNSIVNERGSLWQHDNIYLTDASILPTNIGESPQETLMAFAYKISENIAYELQKSKS